MRFGNLAGRGVLVIGGRAVDIETASRGRIASDPMAYVDLGNSAVLREVAAGVDPADWPELDLAALGPPVPRPRKGFGIGLNYRSHAQETGREPPTEPGVFAKTENCVCGPFDEIVVPAGRERVDYEAEVVIVFGRTCSRVAAADAWSQLAGVTCGQDVSDRAEQFRELRQFTVAKSYDTFGPIGPLLVTADELDRDALELTCVVSGEEMQRGNTNDLIFGVSVLVEWLTRHMTFHPGDLVWTGTPSGVGDARKPPRYLRDGDVVETTVAGVGTMRNPVVVR